MQTNGRGGDHNVNNDTRWLWGGRWLLDEDHTDSDDNWSSNIYAFKFSKGYNIAFVYYWTTCYFVDLLIFSFLMHLLVLNNYGFVFVIWMEKLLWTIMDLCL